MQPSSASTISAADRRHNRRVILILVGMLMLGLASIVWALTWDIDAPDTTDLETPPALNMAGEDFFQLIAQIERLVSSDDIKPAGDIYNDAQFEKKWNQAAVDRLLNSDAATKIWPLIPQILDAGRGRSNWGNLPKHNILNVINLALLMSVRTLNMARQGNPDQALSGALEICALGKRVSEAGVGLGDLLGAKSIQMMGIACIRTSLENCSFSEEAMRHAINEINRQRITAHAVAELLKGEFTMASPLIRKKSYFNRISAYGIKPIPIISKITFKPNLTCEAYAAYIRDAEALLSGENIIKNVSTLTMQTTTRLSPTGYKRYINQEGYHVIKTVIQGIGGALCRWAEVESQLSGLEAFFALRL
ncbi:MAG: hypothetical protein LBM04_03485, partial [Opitutaceae bacterium]|nr:hypothetical protein [Opitutaceae bacterium]